MSLGWKSYGAFAVQSSYTPPTHSKPLDSRTSRRVNGAVEGRASRQARLLGLLAAGETRESVLKVYPYLAGEGIDEALRYAAYLAGDETIELTG